MAFTVVTNMQSIIGLVFVGKRELRVCFDFEENKILKMFRNFFPIWEYLATTTICKVRIFRGG